MTETMLERATAAANSTLDDYNLFGEHRLVARDIARAVIASLREPSEAVRKEAYASRCRIDWTLTDSWEAMIDAILEEGKT